MIIAILFGCAADCDSPGTICTIVGTGTAGLGLEGTPADEANLYWPSDLTIGPDGAAWILDWNNHRIVRVDPDEGVLHVVSGNAMVGDGPYDGHVADALWNHPTNLFFDTEHSFVMAAWHNSRIVRLDLEADTIEILAGNGARDYYGDGGSALDAAFDLPAGVAPGSDGRLYVADQANQRVRCIDGDGVIQTVVGSGDVGFAGDGGPALAASLSAEVSQNADPGGRVAIDGETMYIADTLNNRVRVVDMASWTIDTLAGDGSNGGPETGDARTSGLFFPRDVAVGPDGAVYIADSENHCVRRVQDGAITTVAGVCGEEGFRGDGRAAERSLLARPLGIAVGDDGALWIADSWNHRIRRVAP